MSVFYTFIVASLFTSILQIKPLYQKTPPLTQKNSKIVSIFSPNNLIYMCGLQARHYFFYIFDIFTLSISSRLGKFQVVPEKFHFLEELFSQKLSRYASKVPRKEPNLVVFQDRSLLKNWISQELFGIFQNRLKCIKVKT